MVFSLEIMDQFCIVHAPDTFIPEQSYEKPSGNRRETNVNHVHATAQKFLGYLEIYETCR